MSEDHSSLSETLLRIAKSCETGCAGSQEAWDALLAHAGPDILRTANRQAAEAPHDGR